MNSPCKDCPDREMTCHASCERYQAFRTEREIIYAARIKEQENARPTFKLTPYKISGEQ